MSKERKQVVLDFDGAIAIFKGRGVKKDYKTIASEVGLTENGLRKLRRNTPKAVEVIYHFLKENDLKFEDLVKEV